MYLVVQSNHVKVYCQNYSNLTSPRHHKHFVITFIQIKGIGLAYTVIPLDWSSHWLNNNKIIAITLKYKELVLLIRLLCCLLCYLTQL